MMRNLYLTPIIHGSPDMGSVAPVLDEIGSQTVGTDSWKKHLETVSGFWDSMSRFFQCLPVEGVKIYQDGMVAGGRDGLRIVEEGVKAGSRNYQIISGLLNKGAVLIKTEDVSLVASEHRYIREIVEAKSPREKEIASRRYRAAQRKLLEGRDNYIALTIRESLREGETGILFIGGYHDLVSKLSPDIIIIRVKEPAMVREYHTLLTRVNRRDPHLNQLAEYLASPVPERLT
jgi:hypothetical protein